MLRTLGGLTILFFGVGGMALIVWVQDRDPFTVLFGRGDVAFQLLLGTVAGLWTGFAAWAIIRLPFMARIDRKYADLIGPLISRRSERIWISICAGVGEEIFFRGALQYWLGIPITAILFVAVHGYLDPRDWRISIYGIFMTLAMMLLGWLALRYGLLAPMLAHTIVDIVLLEKLHASWKERRPSNGAFPAQS
jgi:uncharacterized protein